MMDTTNLFECLGELESVNKRLKELWKEKEEAIKFFIDFGQEFTVKIEEQWFFVELDVSSLYNSIEYNVIPCLVPDNVNWYLFEISLQETFLKFLKSEEETKELKAKRESLDVLLKQEILNYISQLDTSDLNIFAIQGFGFVYKITVKTSQELKIKTIKIGG